jgi:hypothetical protein
MKKYFFLFLLTFYFGKADCQILKTYNDYLIKETNPVLLKYADPNFPTEKIVLDVKNNKMEEYAKIHPPIPILHNTGNPAIDKTACNQVQSEWLQNNPYYPQFIPYHLYNRLLTQDDDIQVYEAAKAAWIKTNPEKFLEITNSLPNDNSFK